MFLFRGILLNSCFENLENVLGTQPWWSTKFVKLQAFFESINIIPHHGYFPEIFPKFSKRLFLRMVASEFRYDNCGVYFWYEHEDT